MLPAILAQVFMHSWHILTDNMGSGKSPTKEETQRISFLLVEGFKVSEIHRRLSKFSLKAMRRWCQKLKAGLPLRKKAVRERRVELLIAKEVGDGLAGQEALSVWSTIEARVQRKKPTTVDHLRKLTVRAFDEFSSAERRSCSWAVREEAPGLRGRGRLVVRAHSVSTAEKMIENVVE